MMMMIQRFLVVASLLLPSLVLAFQPLATTTTTTTTRQSTTPLGLSSTTASSSTLPSSSWFGSDSSEDTSKDDDEAAAVPSLEQLKIQILQLGAALDRGQSFNPTSGQYYNTTMMEAKSRIETLVENYPKSATSLAEMEGEWELVLSTVAHGIFRSSPFFLAIQESYKYAEEQEINGEPKANLFFRLHELQTCSWGVSKIGRVAQTIRKSKEDPSQYYLYSEFDTSIFSLTVIPILGWFKLLPTFGGSVITAASCEELKEDAPGLLKMEVDYTTSRKVPGLEGLPLLGDIIWKLKVPVGAIWKLLPWNKGRPALCEVTIVYVDDDFRIVQDMDGDYFVYTRPVVARPLDEDV